MRQTDKILILGASGRTGKLLLEEALNRGFKVNILGRNKLLVNQKSRNLTIFEGTPLDKTILFEAANGCNVIFSTLNISRTSDFPWASLRTPKDFLEKTMQNLIEIHNEISFERIIIVTAWGVAETKKDLPIWFRWLIDFSNIKIPYLGHEQQEKLLKQTSLNYSIVRPVGLTNSNNMATIRVSYNNVPKPAYTISRKNVAHFMLDILKDSAYFYKTITISEA